MKFTICFILTLTFYINSQAQGCSDAGFCTVGSMHAGSNDSSKTSKRKISLLLNNGIGDEGVYVFTPGIQYEYLANAHYTFQGKITGNYASGNLGTAIGLGDLFLSSTYQINPTKKFIHSFTLGTKLPLNLGDIRYNNKPLPMQYQSSLGTIDLIVGYKLKINAFSANLAWQQPLSGINRNTFLPQYINSSEAFKYPPSNDFNRKGDVLFRAAYQIISQKKLKLNASLLNIYHLSEDTYIDANMSNNPIKIAGSKGLTVNITSMFTYQINKSISFGLSAGMPIVVRTARPDGLTRAFSITPELHINF